LQVLGSFDPLVPSVVMAHLLGSCSVTFLYQSG
jgi:hypothetical protein